MMDQEVFDELRRIVEEESGIHLTEEKKPLLFNRLSKRLRALNLKDEREYLRIIQTDASAAELISLIDVVSTNVTYFYREPEHFIHYAETLKRFKSEGRRKVRVWCAASSSGEEPYMLAMLAWRYFDLNKDDFKILASDISTPVLKKALRGIYSTKQLEKLPPEFFEFFHKGDADTYEVVEKIKKSVMFRRLNLAKFPLPLNGPIDIVFCRNVMIYFDLPLRQKLVHNIYKILNHDGYLYLSHSENLLGIKHDFANEKVAVYRKA